MIKELDRIVLEADFPDYGLIAGDLGTVVHIYQNSEAFEVEFLTLEGETVAVVTLRRDQVRVIGAHEIAHARVVHGV